MVVWLGGVVFCWWVLFIRKFILDEPSQISEEPTSGTGVPSWRLLGAQAPHLEGCLVRLLSGHNGGSENWS